jgi:hypothetical protein
VKRLVSNAGAALAVAGLGGLISYFVAVTSDGGRHPWWPYLPLMAVVVFGSAVALYFRSLPPLAPETHPTGHVFISYVHKDARRVDELEDKLKAAGLEVWRDKAEIRPGQDWQQEIKRAISENALAFLACFSSNSMSEPTSYINEELKLAVEQFKQRNSGEPWLIPVRFDDCQLPELDLGDQRTLVGLQRVDLFGREREKNANILVEQARQILTHETTRPRQPGGGSGQPSRRRMLIRKNRGLSVACGIAVLFAVVLGVAGVIESSQSATPPKPRLPTGISINTKLTLDDSNFCTWRFGTHPIPLAALHPPTVRIDNRCSMPAHRDPADDISTTIHSNTSKSSASVGQVLDGQTLQVYCYTIGDNVTDKVADAPPENSNLWLRVSLPAGGSGYVPDVYTGGGYTEPQMRGIGIKRCS